MSWHNVAIRVCLEESVARKQYISFKNTLIIGITLFSMFFGAGNLIFPPLIGAKSGEQFVLAILGLF